MYPLAYSFEADPGLNTTPVLLDTAGDEVGPASVLTVFTAGDWYAFTISLPDGFRGFLRFLAADGTITALFAVNPQEAENLDVKVSAASAGVGSEIVDLTIRSTEHQPVPGVAVWITTDPAGLNTIAGTLYTNDLGVVQFLLDPGNYYIWRKHPTVLFENPKRLTVAAP